ncbi:MAG TPA: hypothetical protein PLQ35_10500 [bacterium]|nr:hypothetical protein [bacterium]HQL62712.1 hypothetical protein [bacterium]
MQLSTSEPFTFLPIIHGCLETAVAVRERLLMCRPDAIAVELPRTLEQAVIQACRRLPHLSVVSYEQSDGQPVYVLIEPCDGIMEAVRFALENEIPLIFADMDTEKYGPKLDPLPDPYAIRRIGYEAYLDEYLKSGLETQDPDDRMRESCMAYHLQESARKYARIALVCGLAHVPGVLREIETPQAFPIQRTHREGVTIWNLSKRSSREVLSEPAFIQAAYEKYRTRSQEPSPDRLLLHRDLLEHARLKFHENAGEKLSVSQVNVFHQYGRNLGFLEGKLAPDLYNLILAARGCADDNFAYELWDAATDYPWHDSTAKLPILDISPEDLQRHSRHVHFHRTFKRLRKILRSIFPRKRENRPGEWRERWGGVFICSYPPEDIVIESYGAFLQKKGKSILSEENTHVEPFTTSLLDGIDIRETVRNWHEGKIYVRESRNVQGKVGSVVVILDEDDPSEGKSKYPWKSVWHGEHTQESDMAFYATPAGEHLVGPGISRCEYGGFLMTYPPGRLGDIWSDPFYAVTRSKPERLLLAGIDYSEERFIVYAARKPPRSYFQGFAGRFNRKIIYIPIGQLSPVTLKQIRSFHVLDGRHVRSYAREYIWK